MEEIKIPVGIYITMLSGKMFFLTHGEYEEDDECFMAKSQNVISILIVQQAKTIGIDIKKLNEVPPITSLMVKIMKSSIETIETLDSKNEMYKQIVHVKSGIIT